MLKCKARDVEASQYISTANGSSKDGLERARALLHDEQELLRPSQRLRLSPFALLDDDLDALDALSLLAPKQGLAAGLDVEGLRTPWLLLGNAPADRVLAGPERAEFCEVVLERSGLPLLRICGAVAEQRVGCVRCVRLRHRSGPEVG